MVLLIDVDIDQIGVQQHGVAEEEQLELDFQVPDPVAGNMEELERIFVLACRNLQQRDILLRTALETVFKIETGVSGKILGIV